MMKHCSITRSINYYSASTFALLKAHLDTLYNTMEEQVLLEGGTITSVYFDKEYGYEDSVECTLGVSYTREENPAERGLREAEEKRMRKYQEQEYKRLKKLFGDK
jgi:hypothetical protein